MTCASSKDKIIDTAISVFAKKGFAETSINDIASAAKISVGLMYRYFKSKQDLFDQIIDVAVEGIYGVIEMFESACDPQEALIMLCKTMIESMKDEQFMRINLMVTQGLISQDHFAFSKILSADEKFIDAICNSIKKGQAQGFFASGDVVSKAHLFLAALQGMIIMKSAFKDVHKPPTADDIMAFLKGENIGSNN